MRDKTLPDDVEPFAKLRFCSISANENSGDAVPVIIDRIDDGVMHVRAYIWGDSWFGMDLTEAESLFFTRSEIEAMAAERIGRLEAEIMVLERIVAETRVVDDEARGRGMEQDSTVPKPEWWLEDRERRARFDAMRDSVVE